MIEVGQELFVVGGFYKRNGGEWKRVEKIVNKYFYLEGDRGKKFHISNLQEDSSTNFSRQCYLTDTEYLERLELDKLMSAIKDRVRYDKLSLGQAQAIAAILGITVDD